MKVGFIGLGQIGFPIAKRLGVKGLRQTLQSGNDVVH